MNYFAQDSRIVNAHRVTLNREKAKLLFLVLFVILMGGFSPVKVYASEADLQAKIMALKTKFPAGKYWNHVGSAKDNENGWTEKQCTCHGVSGVSHVYGTGGCTCNHHKDSGHLLATQCMGFANKLGYDVFGATTWTKINNPTVAQIANIKVGDIIRVNSDSHSVFVIARSGNTVTIGEANYTGKCQISWSRTLNLTAISITYYEHASNYDTITGTSLTESGTGQLGGENGQTTTETTTEATTQATTESTYTGWKKASDGVHYQYYKNGTLLKKKWLTKSGKKYYLNKKGYRVTGLNTIKKKTYYFNSKGVLQKSKWITTGGETYYVGYSGYILRKQWLWKSNILVYVTTDGTMAKSELVKIGSYTYYFNSKSKRSKGFKKVDGKYYYTNKSGIVQKKKWITKSGKTYYVQKSGVRVQSKLVKIGKYKYYFNEKGYLIKKKTIEYKGKRYKADKKGRCKYLGAVTTETTTQEVTTETTTEVAPKAIAKIATDSIRAK